MKDHAKLDHTEEATLYVASLRQQIEDSDSKLVKEFNESAAKLKEFNESVAKREARLQSTIDELQRTVSELTLANAQLKKQLKTRDERNEVSFISPSGSSASLSSSSSSSSSASALRRSALLNRASSSSKDSL